MMMVVMGQEVISSIMQFVFYSFTPVSDFTDMSFNIYRVLSFPICFQVIL